MNGKTIEQPGKREEEREWESGDGDGGDELKEK